MLVDPIVLEKVLSSLSEEPDDSNLIVLATQCPTPRRWDGSTWLTDASHLPVNSLLGIYDVIVAEARCVVKAKVKSYSAHTCESWRR